MTTILHVASSSNLNGSVSRQIGAIVLEELKQTHPGAKIIERDLVRNPIPHVSPEFLGAMFSRQNDAPVLALSEQLISEIIASDILVIEVPMYNFGIPSALKAWIDHVVRAGKTFSYGANGAQGLLNSKKAILVVGRGGIYSEGPYQMMDYQEPYMRAVLRKYMGITDVETIVIEGVALGAEKAAAALAGAKQRAHAVTHAAA
jgi:FMN-dependent NADH-azoreductase